LRGGSWNNNRDNARVTERNRNNPDNSNNNIGFRVVVSHGLRCRPEMSRGGSSALCKAEGLRGRGPNRHLCLKNGAACPWPAEVFSTVGRIQNSPAPRGKLRIAAEARGGAPLTVRRESMFVATRKCGQT
jgi:hypothetical protein